MILFLSPTWVQTFGDIGLPEIVQVIVGFLQPILVQVVKKAVKERWAKFLISLGLSAITGAISFAIVKPEVGDAVDYIVYIFTYSQIAYGLFWKQVWENLAFFSGTILSKKK